MIRPTPTLFVIGWVALTSVGVLALVAPPAAARAKLGREIQSLETELAKPADGPEVIDRLSNDLGKLRDFGEGRMTPIPTDSDVAGLMGMLGGTLTDLGLNQRDITTRPPKSFGDATSLPVTVVLNGPFTSIHEAITRIESMPRLVRVERLRITSESERESRASESSEGGAEGVVRAEFSIDAFYSPDAPNGSPSSLAAETGARP